MIGFPSACQKTRNRKLKLFDQPGWFVGRNHNKVLKVKSIGGAEIRNQPP
jgi:hypothetical protein